MANISPSSFTSKVTAYINNFAVNQVVWTDTINPGATYVVREALAPSARPFQGVSPTGAISVSAVLASIRLNAFYSSSIRRARSGRLTNTFKRHQGPTASNFSTTNDQTRVASLRAPYSGLLYLTGVYPALPYFALTDWRQNLPRNLENLAKEYLVQAGQPISESKLEQFLTEVQNDLNDLINASAVIDLRACHSNCHNDCHGNRTRR